MDPRLIRATVLQHHRRQRSLDRGALPVGWKVGAGDGKSLQGPSVGYLTSESQLHLGEIYHPGPRERVHADVEVAIEIGPDGQPAGYACALELCDLAGDDGPEVVVSRNIFHRAFALGPLGGGTPTTGRLVVNGDTRAEASVPDDLDERLDQVRAVLRAVGEDLRPGELVLTGPIVSERVRPGHHLRAEVDGLGSVSLTVGAVVTPPT